MLNILLFLFGIALCAIVLWQKVQARPNQYLALASFGLALWAIPNGLYYAIRPFELDAEFTVKMGTIIYTLSILAFFYFVTELQDAEIRRTVDRVRFISTLWIGIVLVVAWTGYFWTTPELEGLDYTFSPSLIGFIVFSGVVLTLLYFSNLLRTTELANNRGLLFVIVPLPIGLFFFAIFGAPFGHMLNSLMVLVSVVVLARIVLKNQVFNPLVELYNELTLKNAQLEEVSRRKSEFLANMSHELRTPLNSIIGYTELVLNGIYGDLDGRQADRLEKVKRNGKDLLALINDVLDLSKIDAGRLDLEPIHLSPATLVDQVISTLDILATEKGLQLSRQYQNLPMIYVDEMRARQAILNILASMIRFIADGSTLQLGGYFDAIRNQVVLTVHAGAGALASADAFKLTQAIQENNELPSQLFADFGLGLAVSKRLIEIHGGRLWFDSNASAFHIGFPAAANLNKPRIQTPKFSGSSGPLILVIDDDVEAIEVMQGYLETAGYRIFGALSGHEGILRARELSPDVITLDQKMPGMDGWGVLDILQADDVLNKIPVIMISINDQSHLVKQMDMVVGALTKPLSRNALLNTVRQAAELARA